MIFSSDADFPQLQVSSLDTLPQEGHRAVLTTLRRNEGRLRELSAQMQERLVVPEVWKELLPDAPLLISSAICGGSIAERFSEAAAERSCWLLVEPIREVFPLPCRDGHGAPICQLPEGAQFYSDCLCCYYSHSPKAVVLWDTEETLSRKLQLAKDAGFCGFVLPWL